MNDEYYSMNYKHIYILEMLKRLDIGEHEQIVEFIERYMTEEWVEECKAEATRKWKGE